VSHDDLGVHETITSVVARPCVTPTTALISFTDAQVMVAGNAETKVKQCTKMQLQM